MKLNKGLSFVVYLLNSLAAVGIGLLVFNINVFELPFVQSNLHMLIKPTQVVLGISGLLGLIEAFVYCRECK